MPSFQPLFLLPCLFFLLWACTPSAAEPDPAGVTQPNILLFIADDWSYPHAGVYGDPTVRTPTFDALAAGGMLFTNAYCASPSCSPSRASILTGRYPHENGLAGNLWSEFPRELKVYPELLARAGYFTGHDQKGWAPGDWRTPGWEHNPAGPRYAGFAEFLDQKKAGQPFCYWFGSKDPHREYLTNLGAHTGMDAAGVVVPDFLPDLPCVRNDIMDYYAEVERFDRHVGRVVAHLRDRGELDNTLIIVTSDNGMPFPRAKANLYDAGTRMPFVAHWPARIPAGTVRNSFVNLASLAPTFLAAAGVSVPAEMTLPSVLPQMLSTAATGAGEVILERERHAQVRADSGSYAVRGIRTDSFLYVRNYFPERWPAGDPRAVLSVGAYGDVDNSITKMLILDNSTPASASAPDYFELAFAKRPSEELYDLREDPQQLVNLATDDRHAAALRTLRKTLDGRLRETSDPRATDPRTDFWDNVRYTPGYGRRTFDLQAYIADYRYAATKGPTDFSYRECR